MSASAPPVRADSPPAAEALSGPYRWRWIVLAVVLDAEVMDLSDHPQDVDGQHEIGEGGDREERATA